MKILFLRSNSCEQDSRVQKEMYSLNKYHQISFLGWDRSCSRKVINKEVRVKDCVFKGYNICIEASYGGGLKRNLIALAIFQIKEFFFLIKNIRKYDVVHACDFDTVVPAYLIAKLCRKKLVYDIFDYYVDVHIMPQSISKIIERIDTHIINNADSVIICSDSRRKQIEHTFPKQLAIVHNTPVNSEMELEISNEHLSKKIKIVYVGCLSDERMLTHMIQAIEKREDIELHIGGFGPLEKWIEEKSILTKKIVFYGKMDYESVIGLERQCDIMLAVYDPEIPNHKYAAPNKFYEALMLGKPLMMIENTGMSEYIEQNKLGVLIRYPKLQFNVAFNEAIDKLKACRDEWKEMGKNGKVMYNKEFSWVTMEKRLINMYKGILADERE